MGVESRTHFPSSFNKYPYCLGTGFSPMLVGTLNLFFESSESPFSKSVLNVSPSKSAKDEGAVGVDVVPSPSSASTSCTGIAATISAVTIKSAAIVLRALFFNLLLTFLGAAPIRSSSVYQLYLIFVHFL